MKRDYKIKATTKREDEFVYVEDTTTAKKVNYTDFEGHAKMFTRDEAKELINKLKAGFNQNKKFQN